MKKWIFRLYLILGLVESAAVSIDSFRRLSDQDGLSSIFAWINLVLLVLLAGIAIVFLWLLIRTFLSDRLFERLSQLGTARQYFWGVLIFFILVFIESFQDLIFLQADLPITYYPILLRENQILLGWAAALSLQSVLFLVWLGWRTAIRIPRLRWDHVCIGLGILAGFIFLTSGVQGSLNTNAPLPFLHILAVLVVVSVGGLLSAFLKNKGINISKIFARDVFPLIILWLFAFLLWSNVPLEVNGFIDQPRSPDYQFTPTSDAIYYEQQAHSLRAGNGFGESTQHSLYSYLVSGLHQIGGEHYQDIYRLQITLLALLPFLIYKIASLLGSRFAGWTLGVLMVIREYSALILGNTITVSSVQVLMTEPAATLGVALFIYLVILWLQDNNKNRGTLVLIGAVIGLLVLIRIELLYLWIVLTIICLAVFWKSWKAWAGSAALALLATALIVIPWAARNYLIDGSVVSGKGIVFENAFQTPAQAPSQKQADPEGDQTPDQFSWISYGLRKSRSMWFRYSTSLTQSLVYLPSNHLPLMGLDHFIKVVPEKSRVYLFQEGLLSDVYLTSYVKSLPYWHISWKGDLVSRSAIPLVLILFTIMLGIRRSWNRFGWIGLVPLLVFGTHLLVYAFFNKSGGRYIQVVDWITAFYFVLGLNWLLFTLIRNRKNQDGIYPYLEEFLTAGIDPAGAGRFPSYLKWGGYMWGFVLITAGLSMPVVEFSLPQRYTPESLDLRLDEVEQGKLETGIADPAGLAELASSSGQSVLYGKALYPTFFSAEEKLRDNRQGYRPPVGIDRVVFYLVGTENIWVSIPISEAPLYFPHGAEVLVQGVIDRDSEEFLAQRLKPYFLAERILILESKYDEGDLVLIECDLESCQP